MKKFFSMIMIAAAVFAFAACEKGGDDTGSTGNGTGTKQQLATPQLSETHTETSITVTWAPVENAEAYKVGLGGKYYDTEECTYTFENLNAGTYEILVMALADGYTNSEIAKISVELTGATSVDWFTQTLSLPEADETVDYGNGQTLVYQPYDSVKVLWKGTGVTDLKYALFETADAEGATIAQIKEQMTTLVDTAGEYNLINSEGLEVYFSGCYGSTSYTAYVLVKNEAGIEFLTKNEITTAEAVVTEATKAWLGTWSAYTEKIIDLKVQTTKEQRTDFTFTVSVVPGTTDEVMVDGVSIIGNNVPAFGQVVEKEGINYLVLMNQFAISDLGDGLVATWLPYCMLDDGTGTFVLGQFGAIYLAMDADGSITWIPGEGQLEDGANFTVAAFDVLAYGQGAIGTISDNNGTEYKDWKYGEWKDIKKSTSTQARVMNASARKLSVGSILPMSVVY